LHCENAAENVVMSWSNSMGALMDLLIVIASVIVEVASWLRELRGGGPVQ
jgi:hypothetical protein